MATRKIPPILKTPGLEIIEIGTDKEGFYIKFGANRNNVREITIYMTTPGPAKWTYHYAVYDPTTETVVTYRGRYGDPEKDTRLDIRGA